MSADYERAKAAWFKAHAVVNYAYLQGWYGNELTGDALTLAESNEIVRDAYDKGCAQARAAEAGI